MQCFQQNKLFFIGKIKTHKIAKYADNSTISNSFLN